MNDDISIRSNIMPGDIGSIIKLHGEFYHRNNGFDSTFEPYVAIPLAEFVQRKNSDERIWIVEENRALRGCIAITKYKNDIAQLRWYIVDTSLQGRGIGKELIGLAIDFSKEKKYKKIILWTVDELDKAINMYKKNGFKLTEEKQHKIWGKELTEQCYEKSLR